MENTKEHVESKALYVKFLTHFTFQEDLLNLLVHELARVPQSPFLYESGLCNSKSDIIVPSTEERVALEMTEICGERRSPFW